MRKRGLLIALVVLGCALALAKFAAAAVTVTPATGGTNISADNAANATTPAWTTLGNIVVSEGANGDFAANQANTTLILTAPTNWQFNAGVGTVSFTGTSPSGADLTAASVAVAASTITVTLSTDSNANRSDSMTISGIQVRPTDGSAALPSSGNILRTAGNPGTATIAGIANGTTNFGSLSMAAGAAGLAITSVNGGANPTAGTAFSVTVAKQDQFGHAINAVAATGVSLSLNTGTGTLGGTLTGTIAIGASSTSISGVTYTKAESGVVLTATRTSGDTPLPSGNSAGFTVNPGALANFLVEAAGGGAIGTQTAGTSFNVRVTARDANGNTVTSYNGAGNTVNITSTGTLSAGSGTTATFTNGVLASHAVTISNTGSFTITATRTSGGAQTGTSNSFTVNPGALSSFLVEAAGGGNIGTQTAGTGFNVRITARDANGNTVTSYNGAGNTVDISSTGTLSAGSGTTATFTNGVLASHAVTISNSGIFTITATRTSGGAQTGTSNSFTVNPGALALFLVEQAGGGSIGPQTAGSSFNVRITARDSNGNTVTGFTGTVDITSTGTLSAGSGTTAAFTAGVLSSHAVTISNTGSFTITATRTTGGAQTGTSNSFTVSPGALANFLVEAAGGGSIGTQTAGSSFNVRITARDANNNTVTGFSGAGNTVNITSTGTLSAGSGTTATFTNGVLASHAVTISNTGSFTITATRTSGGAQTGTSNSFTVNPGALANFLVEAAGGGAIGAQTAGSSFNVRVTARDATNNTVTGFTGTVDITSTGTLSAGSGTTAAFTAGVLTSHAVTISNTGSFTLTATRTTGGAQTGTSNSFTVNPGALANFLVEAAGGGAIGTQTAGTGFNVRITARDANNNTVTGFTGTVDITSTGSLSAGSGTTAAFTAGVLVSHAVTVSNTGSFTITATRTTGGAQNGTSNSFTVNPGALANFLVEAAGGGAIGAQTAGSSFNVRVTARDAIGNTVTGYTGTVDITSTGTLSAGSGTTAAFTAGVLSSHAVTLSNTGSFTITATRTSGGAQSGTSNSFTVNPGALANFLVEAAGGGAIGTQTAGIGFNVRITARDANNNTVTGFTGTVDISSTGTLSAGSGTTAAFTAGVLASHAVTVSNTGSFTLTATRTTGGAQSGTSNSFTVNPGALANFLVEAAGGGAIGAQTAGSSFNVRVTARDAIGNTVTGYTGTVDITSTGTLSAGSGTTAAFTAGVLSSHAVTISNTGSFSVTATRTTGGAQTGTSNSFAVGAGAVANFLVEAAGGGAIGTQTAGSSFNVRVTARDAISNTVTGYTGTVDITSTGTLSAGSGTTAAFTAGVLASHAVTVSNTGSFTITATRTTGGAQSGTSNSFTVNPGALANFLVEAAGGGAIGSQAAGTGFNVRITARDANNNTVTGYTGTVDITSTGTLSAGSGTTAAFTAGVLASHAVTVSNTGSFTITATRTTGGAQSGTSNSFTVNPGALTNFLVEAAGGGSIGTQTAGSSFNVRITARDANSNTVTGYTGTVDITSTGTLSAGSGTTAAFTAGVLASHAVTVSNTGSFTITATRTTGGAQSGTSNSFTVNPGAASKLVVTTVPATAAVGTTFSVTVRSQDANGNLANVSAATGVSLSPSGAGSLGGNTATISAGTNSVTLPSVTYDTAETITLTAARTSGDTLATSAASSSIDVKARPTTSIAFPSSGGAYNSAGWAAGCATAGICGMATDNSGLGLATVELSIRRGSGNYWDGSGFNSGAELFVAAGLVGANWSYAFGAGSFPADGDYTIRVRATDNLGGVQSPLASRTFTYDSTAPATVVGFPAAGGTYRAATWNDPSGTASDGGSGLQRVEVSIRRVSSNQYWNGTAFADASENWRTATGTASWSLSFPTSNFPADGDYVFRVRSIDLAGNVESATTYSVTVDTAAPNTSITSQPADPTNATGASFSFTSTEGGSTFECRLDGGAWTACTSPKSYSGLADGSHIVDIRATDTAGNTDASPASFTWTVDTAAPNTSITAQPNDPTNATGASFSFSSSEGGSTFECNLDSGGWTACASPKSYTGLADGSHTFQVRATDAAGNTDATPASFTWTVDTAAPNTSITAQPNDPTNATGASFSFSSSEGGSTFECNLDAGGWTACASPKSYTGLADGSHTFQVRATDAAGNTDATPASFTWTVDTAAPNTTITAQPNDPASSADPSFSFSSTEGGSTFECNLDSGGWTACASPKSYTGLADGSHTFQVRATDAAGNTDATPASFTWTIDTTAPNTTITAQPSDPSNTTDADFSFTSSEGGSSFECRLDGGAWTNCSSPKSYTGLADGSHTFDVRATDGAGNTDASPATFTWTVETTPPDTSISASPSDPSNTAAPSFSFSASEGGSTFECKLDGGAFGACTSPKSYSGLADGSHTFAVRATDSAANTDPTPASFAWTIDTAAPSTSITAQPNDPTNATGASFSFSSSEGGSSFECNLDSGGWTACASPKSYTGLADGSHTFDVRATDAAGNTDASPASFTWAVDTAAPNTTITAQPNDPTNATGASFSFSSSEGGSSFECNLDSGGWSACTSPKSYTGLAEGAHTFAVRATDVAGNTDATPASFTWTIDTTAPETTITAQPNDPTNSTAPSFSFTSSEGGSSFECNLDSGGWTACTSPKSYTGLAEGAHTFAARATDAAGNTDATPASFTWTIDTTAPNTTITAQPSDPTNSTAPSFSFTSSEGGSTFECRLDGGSWTACTSPKSSSGLAQGAHTFDVRSTDAAGNTDATPASFTWTIDTTAPSSVVGFPGAGSTYNAGGWNDPAGTATDSGGSTLDRVEVSVRRTSTGLYWDGSSFANGSEQWLVASGTGTWSRAFASANFATDDDYVVRVRAADTAGNVEAPTAYSFTYDTASPQTTIDSAPNDPSGSADASFSFSSSEPGSSFECRLDGGAWAACTSPKSYTGLADGAHTFDVRATDVAGNVDPSPAGFGWTIDTTAPDTTITAEPTDPSASADASFSFSSSQGGSSFECRIDGGAWAACTSPKSYTGLADGAHTFQVRATDAAGNTDPSPASFAWTIDTAAPNTTITAQPNDPANSADADFSFNATETSTFECRIDGGAWAACASPKNYTGLADGAHTFDVRATDAAGNTDPSPAAFAWTIDTAAPNTTITAQPTDPANSADADFSFNATETSTFECRIDGGAWAACTSPKSYTGLTDGAHAFDVRATDGAGNTDPSPASFGWTIDTVAPNTTITAQPTDPSNSADASFSFSSSQGGSSFECRIDGGAWAACTSPKSYTGLTDGAHGFDVRATDAAGNTDPTPASFGWTIDTAAPNTTITAQPNDPANSADPSFAFSATETSTFECRLDGGAWAACTSPKNYTGLTDGAHAFDVRATDAAGNTDPTPASFGWTIDTAAPNTTITAQPNDPANSADPSFAFSATETSTFECRLDSGAWAACTSPKNYTGLTDGAHAFDVRATDAAGNTDPTPASFGWTIDTAAPNTTITAQPSDPTNSTAPGFSFSSSEGGSTFECNLDSGGWTACPSPKSYAGLTDGAHTFQVRATDSAGNTDPTPASFTWTIDTVAPSTQIDNAPATPTSSQSASFDFSAPGGATFECRLDGGAWAACTSPTSYTGLTEGAHTFDVRATDAAGNTDASPASRTWTIDLTAPTSAFTFPGAGGSYNTAGWNNPSGTAADAVGLDHVEVSLRISGGDWWNGTDFSATSESWQTATGTGSWTFAFPAASFPSDGSYVLRVRAIDTAGNVGAATARTFDVDTVAPETTIDTAPSTPVSDADAAFTFSADQPASTFACRLDGGAWAACTSPRSFTSLAEGAHTFEVRATDVGGNTDPSPATHSWVIDTVPPAATMDDPGPYLRGTVALGANATDTGGTGIASVAFERSPAGTSTWTGIPASWDTTGTTNGLYDLRVVATDLAGNSSSSPALTSRWVDNLKPTVSVDDPGAVTGTFAIVVTATDAHSGLGNVELQVLDGTWQSLGTDTGAPYEFTWDTTTLPDGPHDLRAIATDHAGNVEISATVTVVVDNTDPTVDFTAPTDGGFVNASSPDPFTLVASATDAGSGVKEVEFFDGTTSLGVDATPPYQASWPVPGSDGPSTLTAVARDNAGRESSVDVTFTVDRAVPDTTLGANPGDPSREPAPVFGFSSNEPGSTFECRIDAGAWAACTSPHTSLPLADGPHTFEMRAIDAAGNIDATPASWTWLLDATAPNAAMTDPGANLRGDITLTSTESDPGASPSGIASVEYEYSVADANTWVSVGPQPWHTNAVADGLYDLRVVVTDNAGNRTESAPVEDRRIDNSPPATALDDPGANLRATVTLKGSASDTGSGVQQVEFEYSVDGMSWSPLAGGIDSSDPYEFALDTTGLADGFYFFRTKATDVAGNTAWSAGVGPRRVDNTPPIAILNDPGANLRGTVTLTSTADDPGGSGVASVVYHYTGPETGTTSSAWTTTDVADGVYDLTVEVMDVAGNVTMSNVVGGRRVDNTAPTTGHNAPGGWQSSAVTVGLSANDGGSGVANTQFAVDGGGWNSGTSVNVSGDGVHTISFFSTDVAGNVESAQTATVSIDTTPPDAGALDPGNYLSGTVTLSANPSSGTGGADLAEVEFQRKLSSDSTWTSIGADTTAPYSASWVTTPADDGSWDFRFIARDTATPANESITDFPSKIVDNTAPTGAVTSPLTGAVVSGGVTLGVSASDANPIASVEYFVDGGSVGSSSGTPYQVSWNSASTGDGSHSISAVITDMAGNSTSTGGVGVTVDNFAPTVSVSGLPANVSGSVSVSASASSDTATVAYEARLLPSGGWSSIGSSSGGSPWQITWTPGIDGTYEVRAKATDAGGNSGTSAVVTTRVDNTDPSGLLTAPGDGATVGGTVNLAANASDSGSGVAAVTWQAQSGGGGFSDIASDSGAPYDGSWNVAGLPSGSYDLRIVVTDLAGNSFTSAPITVDVDATAPGVTLNNPGSPLSGTVALGASTTGDATSVTFSRSPAGAATWTAIGSDGSAPYGASFNTSSVADGLYDLRAVVTDAVGNTSQSVVGGIRVDNFIPMVVSSVPANGSIVASASQIAITASEAIASLTGVTLDGAPAAAPTISGATATFNTGALANGTHTLAGTVHDAAGNSSAFSITFMVGVPTPPADGGGAGGTFGSVLPLVPAPLDFRGVLEDDGSLTLRWTPSQDAKGRPFATILFVDGIATQTLAAGENELNLGPFDPADTRVFSIAAVDADGHASAASQKLRSSSRLAGKTLEEATAILAGRGFELGAVRGTGTVVVSGPVVAPLGSKVDVELGQPGTPQPRFVFGVVGTKRFVPSQRKAIAIRVRTTRTAQVTANLIGPSRTQVHRWRFSVKVGVTIKRLAMPSKVRRAGTYRVVFNVQSGRDTLRRTIAVRVVGKRARPDARPVEVVLAGGPTEIARGLGSGTRVVPAIGEETWTIAGSQNRNVQVIVVDVDRYGLQLVKDLRTVFPSMKIIALTNDPRRLAQAIRAGAAVALPRSTPPADIAKLIRRLTRR